MKLDFNFGQDQSLALRFCRAIAREMFENGFTSAEIAALEDDFMPFARQIDGATPGTVGLIDLLDKVEIPARVGVFSSGMYRLLSGFDLHRRMLMVAGIVEAVSDYYLLHAALLPADAAQTFASSLRRVATSERSRTCKPRELSDKVRLAD